MLHLKSCRRLALERRASPPVGREAPFFARCLYTPECPSSHFALVILTPSTAAADEPAFSELAAPGYGREEDHAGKSARATRLTRRRMSGRRRFWSGRMRRMPGLRPCRSQI